MAAIHFKCLANCPKCHGMGYVAITHKVDSAAAYHTVTVRLCECAAYYRVEPTPFHPKALSSVWSPTQKKEGG